MYKIFYNLLLIACSISLCTLETNAQMVDTPGDTLVGNEWIDYNKTYLKIKLSEDGLYSLSGAELANYESFRDIKGSDLQLWHMGKQVPLYVLQEGPMADTDLIYFYGVKNRGELDKYLFAFTDEKPLNPYYSLLTGE